MRIIYHLNKFGTDMHVNYNIVTFSLMYVPCSHIDKIDGCNILIKMNMQIR